MFVKMDHVMNRLVIMTFGTKLQGGGLRDILGLDKRGYPKNINLISPRKCVFGTH